MAPRRKRKAEDPGEGRATKIPRASGSASRSPRSTPARQPKYENADVVDLVDVEDDAQYEDFRARQQAEAIKQQAQEEANRPIKLAEFQCIICMDNPTDLTVTHCGMYPCHFCLEVASDLKQGIFSAPNVYIKPSMLGMERKRVRCAGRPSTRVWLGRIKRSNLGMVYSRWR